MRPVALSDEIAVGEMPTADEIAILAKAGFKSLLSVQPEGEVGRLLSAAETEKVTREAGVTYAHVPVATRRPGDDIVEAFAKTMAGLPRPIYACCYSGARAAAAWALAVAPAARPADVAAACAAAGYDVSSLMSEIERRHAGRPAETLPSAWTDAPKPRAATGDAVANGAALNGAASQPAAATSTTAPTAPQAATAAAKIIFPRAAGEGGFAVSG